MKLAEYKNDMNDSLLEEALRLNNHSNKIPAWLHARCNFLSKWLNIPAEKYYGDVRVMLESQLEFRKRFKGVNTLAPDYGVALLPSAFGIKVVWPEGFMIPAIKDLTDFPEYVEQLEIPDPRVDGYLPAFYNAFFYFKSIAGDLLEITHPVLSPFEIAASLVGTNNIFEAMYEIPESLHSLLDKTTKFMIDVYEHDAEIFNIDEFKKIYLGEDLPGLLSPEKFKEFVFPYSKKIYDYFSSPATLNIWHCDSRMEHLIEIIPEMGVDVLYNFDPETDLKKYINKIGDEVALVGNIHPIEIMCYGTPADVAKETKRQLNSADKINGYVASPGGELPSCVPEENIDIFLKTVFEHS